MHNTHNLLFDYVIIVKQRQKLNFSHVGLC